MTKSGVINHSVKSAGQQALNSTDRNMKCRSSNYFSTRFIKQHSIAFIWLLKVNPIHTKQINENHGEVNHASKHLTSLIGQQTILSLVKFRLVYLIK